MKTKLLVLIDFSPYSLTLLKFANAWYEKSGSEILVIHQLQYPQSSIRNSKTQETSPVLIKNKVTHQLSNLIRENINEKATVRFEILTGDIIDYLKNLQTRDSNYQIMLGMKGNTAGDKPVMGELTKAINNNLNCLTVIIPVTLKSYLPSSLTVGLSCKFPLNKPAFNSFLMSVSSFITHIRFISVMASSRQYKKCHEYMLNLTMEYNHFLSSEFEVFQGISAFHTVKEYIAQLPETMFVVQKGEQLFTDKISHKFLVNDLVYDTSIPLVVIPQ